MERHAGDRETTSLSRGIRRVIGRLGLARSVPVVGELSPEVARLVERAVREGYPEVKEFADRLVAAGFRVHEDNLLGFRADESAGGGIPLRGEGTNAVRAAKIIGNARRGLPLEHGIEPVDEET